jgi:tetratricopeptide (TPR) repeat protein
MSFEFSLAESIGKEIMVCGYSGQRKEELYKQFYEERIPGPDEMVERDDGFLYYKHTTKKGNSGGPVLIKTASSEFKVVGVHKGSYKSNKQNCCIMVKTIEKLNPTFQTQFQEFTPEECIAFEWKEIKIPKIVLDEAEEIKKAEIDFEVAEFNMIKHRYNEAIKFYKLCLKIQMKKLGVNSIQVASTLNNIGLAHWNRGEYEKALEQYNKCLEIEM